MLILFFPAWFYTSRRQERQFAAIALGAAILIAFTIVGAIGSYLVAALGFPLRDEWFGRIDASLGLDWMAGLRFMAAHPLVGMAGNFLYSLSLPLVVAVMLYLAFTRRYERMELFVTSIMAGAFVTIIASGPLAAMGPYVYYAPPASLWQSFGPAVLPAGEGSPYIAHLEALRAGTMKLIHPARAEGIIVFPSFHTIMSLLMIFALRNAGRAFVPGLIVNLLILLSVPYEGGHYFADMISGALVALAVWNILGRWQRARSGEEAAASFESGAAKAILRPRPA